jgi:uncharacterized protein YndB with AHSA1/START domain
MTETLATFVYVTYIQTTPEKLWAALTTPEFTTRYWNGRQITSDWQPGSPVRFRHDYDDGGEDWGEVLAVEEPRRLSYGHPQSAVTFELTAHDDVVRLTVTHTGVGEQAAGGWSFILANLKTLLETGSPLSMPDKVLAAYR